MFPDKNKLFLKGKVRKTTNNISNYYIIFFHLSKITFKLYFLVLVFT